uniref:Uncharacterized protein n=1 Tax=Leersia perrieri TaxID=77586 RepID=A0A0D9VDM0_9ORYZ
MTIRSETGAAATKSVVVAVEPPITASPPWRLRRQRSVPAAVVSTFAPCVGISSGGAGSHHPPRVLRLGGTKSKSVHHYDRHDFRGGEEEEDYGVSPAARKGGVGVLRALWRRIVRGRRWKVMSRSGSSTASRHYAQEEYEQNFDEGAAAAGGEPEPEYLSRSFSARYAGSGGRRSAGMAIWGVAAGRVAR